MTLLRRQLYEQPQMLNTATSKKMLDQVQYFTRAAKWTALIFGLVGRVKQVRVVYKSVEG